MKTLWKSRDPVDVPDHFELYDPRLDNLMRVENRSTCVVIRTARDNLSSTARDALVRYLAAEGLIAEGCRWNSETSGHSALGVTWLTDSSWVDFNHQCRRLRSRVWAYLTWGRLLSLGLFLAATATALWLKPR
jgi:hypothetical protein